MELARQRDWAEQTPSLWHYRDKQQREVDVILELGSEEIAGVEIKTAASVNARDFAGLRHLRDRLGDRFQAGVVLYTGRRTLSFGERRPPFVLRDRRRRPSRCRKARGRARRQRHRLPPPRNVT